MNVKRCGQSPDGSGRKLIDSGCERLQLPCPAKMYTNCESWASSLVAVLEESTWLGSGIMEKGTRTNSHPRSAYTIGRRGMNNNEDEETRRRSRTSDLQSTDNKGAKSAGESRAYRTSLAN
jgi:hypothetical protein